MQAGVVDRRASSRDVFTAVAGIVLSAALLIRVRWPQDEALAAGAAA